MKTGKSWQATFLFAVGIVLLLPQTLFAAEEPAVKCLLIGREPHGETGILNESLSDIKANYPTVDITVVEKENLEALRYENLKKYEVLMVEQIKGDLPNYAREFSSF
jgi:hypothetical protein